MKTGWDDSLELYWFERGKLDNKWERDPLFRNSKKLGIYCVRSWCECEDMKKAGEAYLKGFGLFQ